MIRLPRGLCRGPTSTPTGARPLELTKHDGRARVRVGRVVRHVGGLGKDSCKRLKQDREGRPNGSHLIDSALFHGGRDNEYLFSSFLVCVLQFHPRVMTTAWLAYDHGTSFEPKISGYEAARYGGTSQDQLCIGKHRHA